MGTINRTYNFTNGSVADADQVDTDFNTIYDEFNGNIENANIKATAGIETSKLELSTGATASIDLNGQKIDLDADADTSIHADTDDQIDIEIAGADDFRFTANTFKGLSGSSIGVANNNFFQADESGGTARSILGINSSDVGYVGSSDIDFALKTRCFASVYRTTSGQSITASVTTKVEFNGETSDPGGDFDSTTNYRYTAPVAGRYAVFANIRFSVTADLDVLTIFLYKNGVEIKRVNKAASSTTNQAIQLFHHPILSAGDYLEIFVSNSSNNDTVDAGETLTWAEFYLHSLE